MKPDKLRFFIYLVGLILLSLSYRWLSIPPVEQWSAYTLTLTPHAEALFAATLESEPWKLFLPMDQGGGGRYSWNPAKSLPVYFLSKNMSPVTLYLLLTTVMVVTLYVTAYNITKSLRFAIALGFIAALSTFLNYTFVYGSVARNYLFISYMAVAAVCLVKYLQADEKTHVRRFVFFIFSMFFVIFSGELWLNLGLPFLFACLFGFIWARRHDQEILGRRIRNVSIFLTIAVVAYVGFRIQYAQTYLRPGFESEMVFTYSSPLLMIEDMIINYLTYVHITLSGVLPGHFTFSPSYTFVGEGVILAEQNGYHQQFSNHVVSSHLTSWRFVGGMLFIGMLMAGWHWIKAAWNSPQAKTLVPVFLILIVAMGFLTYLPVKMRPMHLTAMLGYKTLISSTALMALLAWVIYTSEDLKVPQLFQRLAVGVIVTSVALAAFTRPAMHSAGLEAVGLKSGGDPIVKIRHLLKGSEVK